MKPRFDFLIFLSGLVVGMSVGISLSHLGLVPSFRRAPAEPVRELTAATPGAVPPHVRGVGGAPVVLEEFADFECPPCAGLYPELKKIEADYGDRIAVVFRHFPLSMHKHALAAAKAAEAAALQGRFWEMHDRLYEKQDEWSQECDVRRQFVGYAHDLGLDVGQFERDMDSAQVAERIRLDQQRGESAQVDSTPSLFLNGRELSSSSRTPGGIRAAIDAALKGK